MSDPSADEAASGPKAGGAAGPSGESAGATPPRGPDRRRLPAGVGLLLIAIAVVLIVTDPFAGSPKSGSGGVDNGAATALTTVSRRSLSAQTQVGGTLGYAGSSSIRVPSGTPPSGVSAARQSVTTSEAMLSSARTSLMSDGETLADHRATVSATRGKETVDCAGDGAAESASSGSPPAGGGGSGLCASDALKLRARRWTFFCGGKARRVRSRTSGRKQPTLWTGRAFRMHLLRRIRHRCCKWR